MLVSSGQAKRGRSEGCEKTFQTLNDCIRTVCFRDGESGAAGQVRCLTHPHRGALLQLHLRGGDSCSPSEYQKGMWHFTALLNTAGLFVQRNLVLGLVKLFNQCLPDGPEFFQIGIGLGAYTAVKFFGAVHVAVGDFQFA